MTDGGDTISEDATLTFHGAAETVTGSKYLLEAGGRRVLVDCGIFQGLKSLRERNWSAPRFDPAAIDALLLTHAHIDHIGYLPRLTKIGFTGPVYCTPATDALAAVMLLDAAKIQEADADYANRKGYSKHRPALPLYDADDAERSLRLLKPIERKTWLHVAGPIWARWHDAGHLLGSNMIEVELREGGRPTRILFSGDVGRYDAPLYHDPSPPPACDALVCEATYGDRDHPPANLLDELAETINAAVRRGGVMLVAAFAVGRSQQLIYLMQLLIAQNRIPDLPIYLDSPMAVDATEIFCKFSDDHDLSEGELKGDDCMFHRRNVHLSRSVAESKEINRVNGPAIVISSSGMMTGGRILHHLRQRLDDPRNTIVIGGYQAEGTRGRSLLQGAKTIRIHGRDVPVRAAVTNVSGLSGHAGRGELLRWLGQLETPPRQTYITHAEPSSAAALAATLRDDRGWNVQVAKMDQTVSLPRP